VLLFGLFALAPVWLHAILGGGRAPAGQGLRSWLLALDWTPQSVLTAILGIAALATAIITIRAARFIGRAKATLDFLEKIESQHFYQERDPAFRNRSARQNSRATVAPPAASP
jgi:hypothetical protein